MHSKRILLAVIALCVITLYSISSFAQQFEGDCRRRKDPTGKGVVDLNGDWMDNSVKLKVHIIQIGANLNGSAEVIANYDVPYKCAYPPAAGMSGFGNAVMLDQDFTGQLTNSKIEGEVYICQSGTATVSNLDYPKGIPTESNSHTESYSVRVAGKLKDMTVSEDGNSIQGTFADPSKGTLKISFTRLSKPDKYPYQPDGRIRATGTTSIYDEPGGRMGPYVVLPGTRLIFDDLKPDGDGNPWYHVTNGEGAGGSEYSKSRLEGSGLQHSTNVGWVPASSITCDNPNPKAPGKAH